MHKLIDFLCDELEDLERKVERDGKLSASEIEYGDKLAHFKKNLLKMEQMEGGSSYSMMYPYSYERDGERRRNPYIGRYSRAKEDFMTEFRELMQSAPNDHVRRKMQDVMNEM